MNVVRCCTHLRRSCRTTLKKTIGLGKKPFFSCYLSKSCIWCYLCELIVIRKGLNSNVWMTPYIRSHVQIACVMWIRQKIECLRQWHSARVCVDENWPWYFQFFIDKRQMHELYWNCSDWLEGRPNFYLLQKNNASKSESSIGNSMILH